MQLLQKCKVFVGVTSCVVRWLQRQWVVLTVNWVPAWRRHRDCGGCNLILHNTLHTFCRHSPLIRHVSRVAATCIVIVSRQLICTCPGPILCIQLGQLRLNPPGLGSKCGKWVERFSDFWLRKQPQ